MDKFPRQIILKNPLRDFMGFCEVYCTAECCEKLAFEVHPALLRRRMIDFNLAGKDGEHLLEEAFDQFKSIRNQLLSPDLQTVHEQVPFWADNDSELPNYWIELDGLKEWLQKWEYAFIGAISPNKLNDDRHAT